MSGNKSTEKFHLSIGVKFLKESLAGNDFDTKVDEIVKVLKKIKSYRIFSLLIKFSCDTINKIGKLTDQTRTRISIEKK